MSGLLLITIFLPLAGALLIWSLSDAGPSLVRPVALGTTLLTAAAAAILVFTYPAAPVAGDPMVTGEALVPSWQWLAISGEQTGVDVEFSVALDGLGLWMFGLSALLMITSVLVSWEAVTDQRPAFYSLLLILETGMLGVFTARDIILFYVFFEATLIPLFFLIGIWGGSERRYAAIKFFLFTLSGSVLTFLGLLTIVLWNSAHSADGIMTFSIPKLTAGLAAHPMDLRLQIVVFIALFAGFAIKVPLFPLHTWLPLAHVEAPTAGSILLAGVLLKIGTYGFVRFSLPMLPEATATLMPWVLLLSTCGGIYGALVALAQNDIKRLIAYSSVSHLGYAMLGLFALNGPGLAGGALIMIAHGLSTGGLFAVVGMLYERYHTREIAAYSGLAAKFPRMAASMVLLTFASIGVPGLCGFAGEFLVLLGLFQRAFGGDGGSLLIQVCSIIAVCGIVLGAWYMLWLVRQVFYGPLHTPHVEGHDGHAHGHAEISDMNFREFAALAPLFVFIFWIGLQPSYFLSRMNPSLEYLSRAAQAAADRPAPPAGATAAAQDPADPADPSAGDIARVD
jgi:NADH-quinone oxidoreductase subunit M